MQELDNPIWFALQTADCNKNVGNSSIAIFSPDVSPFVGMAQWDEVAQKNLFNYLPPERVVSTMIAEPFKLSSDFELVFSLNLYQMVCIVPNNLINNDFISRALTDENIPEMLALTSLTKPGPFFQRTIEFGNYEGIFSDGKLVAMTGERLHLNEFTEVSAVCTHPSSTGKGYALNLVNRANNRIHLSGRKSFLHVRQDNERAIKMYEGLGFSIRKEMYFAVIKPKK